MNQKQITVTVKKEQLLETLRENKKKHEAEFVGAVEGWKIKCFQKLDKKREDIASMSIEDLKKDDVHCLVSVECPRSHADEYQRAIEMLEWHEGETLTLDQTSFRRYVQDEWDWTRSFKTLSASYKGS